MGRRGGGDLCSSAVTSAVFTCLRSQFPCVVSGTISSGGPGGEAPGTAVSRAQLGFHDWEAASDYARAGWGGVQGRRSGGGSFLQGPLKVFLTAGCKGGEGSGDECESHGGEIRHYGPVNPLHPEPTGTDQNQVADVRWIIKSMARFKSGQKYFYADEYNRDIFFCLAWGHCDSSYKNK